MMMNKNISDSKAQSRASKKYLIFRKIQSLVFENVSRIDSSIILKSTVPSSKNDQLLLESTYFKKQLIGTCQEITTRIDTKSLILLFG